MLQGSCAGLVKSRSAWPWPALLAHTRPPRCQKSIVCCAFTQRIHAVVVGGGVGGLAAAGRLAKAGLSVTLFEKNAEVGGRAQSVDAGQWRFDTGPSLLLMPDAYRGAFSALGTSLDEHVTLERVEPAYRVFFGDNTSIDLSYNVDEMVTVLDSWEPGAGSAYVDFLASSRAALDLGLDNFVARDFEVPGDIPRLLSSLPLLARVGVLDLLGQHAARLARRFKDPRLQALFTFQDLYVGLSPYTAPAVFSLLFATEMTDGVWYPVGGFGKVRSGLETAARHCGVTIRCGAEVREITHEGKAVTGVTLASGEHAPATVVIANRDLPAAYELVEGDYGAARHAELARKRYSAGVISYCWSLDRTFPSLQHHNIFLSGEYSRSWDRACDAGSLLPRPNFYVHCPARTDPTAAPAGGDSIMVLLPVANLQETMEDAYDGLVEAGRLAVFRTLVEAGVGDLSSHIVAESVRTPAQWRELYGLQHGAAFGLDHALDQLSIFRPPNKDLRMKGLYFVGASTRPGNGVPLVLMGAGQVADRILSDLHVAAASGAFQTRSASL